MKKKIVMALLVMAMSASVFTGCGNRIEGDGKVLAAVEDSGDSQEEKEDIPESGTAENETVESTETEESEDGSIPESDTEPSEGSVESSATGDNDTAKGAKTSTQANGSNSAATDTQTEIQANSSSEVDSASSGTMPEFVDYLNQQRAAMGLSQISWDSGLAAEAQRRAEEIVANFSHDGRGNYLENLYKGGSNGTSDVYTAWYNSSAHKATLLNTNLARGACSFVAIDEYYYVVFLGETETPVMSAQEWNDYKEEAVENGEMQHYEVNDGGSITDVYIEGEGGIVTEDDPMYDEVNSWDWG